MLPFREVAKASLICLIAFAPALVGTLARLHVTDTQFGIIEISTLIVSIAFATRFLFRRLKATHSKRQARAAAFAFAAFTLPLPFDFARRYCGRTVTEPGTALRVSRRNGRIRAHQRRAHLRRVPFRIMAGPLRGPSRGLVRVPAGQNRKSWNTMVPS